MKIREEIDADTNEKKMDMVVVSGIRPNKRWPNHGSYKEKAEWLRNEAVIALKKIDKKIGERDVKWANNFSNPSTIPLTIEIKLCNKETSLNIKRSFREFKRDDARIEDGLYIAATTLQPPE
jgi:hypothetical protein